MMPNSLHIIPSECIEELARFKTIYCLVSGGKDSTALAIALGDISDGLGEIKLLHTNTGLRMKSSTKTLQKLQDRFGFDFIELKPTLKRGETIKNILIESFKATPKAIEKKYDRRVFICCKKLKYGPGLAFIDKMTRNERNESIFLSSITKYESKVRFLFLAKLENLGIFTRFNKTYRAFYGYPLRDVRSPKMIEEFLLKKGFSNVRHSGCRICPIVLAKDLLMKDPNTWVRSRRFALENVKGINLCKQGVLEKNFV